MALTPISLGVRSNVGRANAISAAKLINCYPEDAGEEGKIRFPIVACDGFSRWDSTISGSGTGSIKAGIELTSSALYVVSGNRIIKLNASGTPTLLAARTATVTFDTATDLVTWTSHGLAAGAAFVPTTTGALPTGLTPSTAYYVIASGMTANAFKVSATPGGAAVDFSGSQSGTHTGSAGADIIISTGLITMARNRKEPNADIGIVSSAGNFYIVNNDTLVDYTGLLTTLATDASSTVTITIASPGVVTWTSHGLQADQPIVFTTSSSLPTGITSGTTYYVVASGLTADTFRFSETVGGVAVNTSGSQAGTQTATATGGGGGTVTSIAAIDGYFVLFFDNGEFFISSIDDGDTIDPLEFAKAESNPDGGMRVAVRGRDLLLFGPKSLEGWNNVGAADFPFERFGAASIGCYAAGSVVPLTAVMDGRTVDTVIWAATNSDGAYSGIMVMSDGLAGQKISTLEIDRAIEAVTDPTSIRAFAWSKGGHTFYTITDLATFSYSFDTTQQFWPHQRTSSGLDFWRIGMAVNLGSGGSATIGKVILGDYTSAKLYKLTSGLYDADNASTLTLSHSNNNGNTFPVARTAKTISGSSNLTQRMKYTRLGQSKEDGKVFKMVITRAVMEDTVANSMTIQPSSVHAWPRRMRFFKMHIDVVPGSSQTSTAKAVTGLAIDAVALAS
jgi:hypothetical protein